MLKKNWPDLSIRNGADAIKNQTHLPEMEMVDEAKKIKPVNARENICEVIKKN